MGTPASDNLSRLYNRLDKRVSLLSGFQLTIIVLIVLPSAVIISHYFLTEVVINYFESISTIDTSKRGIKDFNRQTRLLLSSIGIKKNSLVVFYDNISGMYAARGVWLLLYFSHEKVCMLNGGFEKWKKEGYSIELKSNPLKSSGFRGKPNAKILATAQDVMRSLNNKNVVIVDARSRKEYVGYEVRAARRGHIPSAVNIDWNGNIEKDVFKSKQKLSKIYSKIPKDVKIITYCQGGYRAAHTFLTLKMLGYKT